MNTLNIEKANAEKAYKEADKQGKSLLENLFGKKMFVSADILDCVTTWEQVAEIKGLHPVMSLPFPSPGDQDEEATNAFFIITKAGQVFNEGWVPDWKNSNQRKYVIWWDMSGVRFSFLVCGCVHADAAVGSRLCYKSEEVLRHMVKHFLPYFEKMNTIK